MNGNTDASPVMLGSGLLRRLDCCHLGWIFQGAFSWYFLLVLGSLKAHMPPNGWEVLQGHNYANISNHIRSNNAKTYLTDAVDE